MATGDIDTSVKVAVRIRPQNAREQIDMCRVCTSCTPDTPQIVLGKDKAFTYDYVFDTMTYQEQIYTTCVEELVNGCFDGYNATVLAYGQTGSGKTYTMGTGFDMTIPPDEVGMIPRAVRQIFAGIEERKRSALEKDEPLPHFEVKTQFLELYNEEIIDLFEEQNKGKLRIHEDAVGNIYVAGATEIAVTSEEETLGCLKRGALSRTVGSTNMNAQSSRSHAIFSVLLVHQRLAVSNSVDDLPNEENLQELVMNNPDFSSSPADWETLKAKFHFVDLAGSERLKRTGATGERAKEGISINCGLLALGNVISALGDKAKKGSHVPYRDSKLTRLLQDSLGGNSKTLMIACISPTDRDFMETLNTLKYSNRARNIKNKVVVNQDKMSQQLTALRSKMQELEVELQEFRSGRKVVSGDGSVVMNDMANEITMLRTENDKLRLRIKAMQQVVESQSNSIASLTAERDCLLMGHQDESTGQVVSNSDRNSSSDNFTNVIQGYITQIEELKSKLIMSESMARQSRQVPVFHRTASTVQSHFSDDRQLLGSSSSMDIETNDLLKVARGNIEKLKEREKKEIMSNSRLQGGHKAHVSASSEADSSLEESSDEGSDDTEETVTVHVSSSDESESDKEETGSLASSIAELSSEINLKQQLVDQLEKAQRNIYSMKTQYEEKMQVLQHQIKSIESERDRVLKDMAARRNHERSDEKIKEIKVKYERQLNDLKSELKTLKSAKKEHAKAIRKNAQHEKDLKFLKNELLDMKKQRVKMLNKMREAANLRKLDEAKRTKEIRQLQKERRTREHKIKLLESDAKRKELVLKRRQEEVAALRRNNRYKRDRPPVPIQNSLESSQATPLPRVEFASVNTCNPDTSTSNFVSASETSSGYGATVVLRRQTGNRDIGSAKMAKRRMSSIFSSESARKKWRNLEKKILDATNKRQTMANLSRDMDTWIDKRHKLSQKVDDLRRQKQALLQSEESDDVSSEVAGIDEDMDSLSAHIEYVQENIIELQNDLIAVDDVKCDGDTVEAHSLISSCSPKEAKYLLEHLLDKILDLGVKAFQMESDVKSLEARLKASEQSAEIIQSLSSPQVSSTTIPLTDSKLSNLASCRALYNRSLSSIQEASKVAPSDSVDGSRTSSESTNDVEASPRHGRHAVVVVPTELSSDKNMQDKKAANDEDKNQLSGTRQFSKDSSPIDDDEKIDDKVTSRRRGGSGGSCDHKKKAFKKKSSSGSSSDLLSASSQTGNNGSSSPNLGTKPSRSSGNDGAVWSRLTSSASGSSDSSKGVLQTEKTESRRSGTGKLLHCTHTASGHSASVLSVCATQNYLFSASQDRTVKIWNLKTCTELLTLDKHFSYVRCVRFCPKNNIIFTASQSLIKLWDMRHHRARCINTFGLNSTNGVSVGAEYAVQDLIVSPTGDMLYSASGNFINIWDLKKSKYLGRFVGHNGALCALAIKGNLMATGARDRLIKLYDLESMDASSMINQPSICTLYPPHYDAVSSLALHKDFLFSSCGVTIKQWDIKERNLKQALDGAHSPGSTINSLAIFNSPLTPLLVSGCKGGVMKMWNPETCGHLGEIASHKSSINSISTNGTCIFTGSSDKTVRIWRPSPQDS